jgi:hypothetical protein
MLLSPCGTRKPATPPGKPAVVEPLRWEERSASGAGLPGVVGELVAVEAVVVTATDVELDGLE